jgi:hypothetical protein
MSGAVRVYGGLLLLEEGGPINGRYRFAPDQPGAVWSGMFSDAKAAALAASQAARSPKAKPDKPKAEPTVRVQVAASGAGAAASGVKKKQINGDYKKRRKPVPSEAVLAKRSAAKERALAAKEKAAAARALAKTNSATKPKPKPKPKTKPRPLSAKKYNGIPAPPRCSPGFVMVWRDKSYIQIGNRIVQAKMMSRQQGRVNGHWLKQKVMQPKV